MKKATDFDHVVIKPLPTLSTNLSDQGRGSEKQVKED